MSIEIVCCYAHEDQQLLNDLKGFFIPLQRQGRIIVWADTDINAGSEWEKEIEKHLETAPIILLLATPDFMSSEYCYSKEMMRAIERHERGEAIVIPIILRPIDLQGSPFGRLQTLPKDEKKPVTSWSDREQDFFDVAEGIRKAVEQIENRIQAAILAREFHIEVEYTIERSNVINAETVACGKRLTLTFHINNNLPFAFSIWLGANLRLDEQYFYNIEEDAEVILRPGSGTYKRFLTIRNDWPSGDCYLDAAAYFGIRSDPGKSILLDGLWTHPSLKVT